MDDRQSVQSLGLFMGSREDSSGTDPQVTPEFIPSGHVRVTGDFVGICTRPVHAQDGDIQCFKHRLWRSSRIHRTVVTAVTFVYRHLSVMSCDAE